MLRRRGGVGVVRLNELTGVESVDAFFERALRDVESFQDLATRAAAAQSPGDLAKIGKEAKDAQTAKRRENQKWVAGTGGSIASVALMLGAASVIGAPLGVAIAAVAAAAVLVISSALEVIDYISPDHDGEKHQERAAEFAGRITSNGFPFPDFVKERHAHIRYWADELQGSHESIENMPPEHIRDALYRAGRGFLSAVNDEAVVLAMYLVGGEGGRNWTYVRSLYSEQKSKSSPVHLASNRTAMDLMIAAVGVTCAREANLPATHFHACIDAARDGWEAGAAEASSSGYSNPGSAALGVARIWSEDTAARLRAQLDGVAAEAPGAVGMLYGNRYEGFAIKEVSHGVTSWLGMLTKGRSAPVVDAPPDPVGARSIDPAIANATKPPTPKSTRTPSAALIVRTQTTPSNARGAAGVAVGALVVIGTIAAARHFT